MSRLIEALRAHHRAANEGPRGEEYRGSHLDKETQEVLTAMALRGATEEQAFPRPVTIGPTDDVYHAYPGMTKREYMATAILAALVTTQGPGDDRSRDVVDEAIKAADALRARLTPS